jgi:hypothetical protein
MQLACWILARVEVGAVEREGVVVEDAGDFELVTKGRMLKVAVANGSAVLEREATVDSAKGWAWGFFGFELLSGWLPVKGVELSGLVAIEAFFPLLLQVTDAAWDVSNTPRNRVLAREADLGGMKAFEDEFFGFCESGCE